MKTHYRFDELPGFSRLYADLTANPHLAGRWVEVAGRNQERLMARAADALAMRRSLDSPFREMLLTQNSAAGGSAEGRRYLERVREGRFLLVGGLSGGAHFGGHLAILYKALTAVKAVRHLESFDVPAVPLIWIDAELGVHPSCVLDMQNVARMIPAGGNGSGNPDQSREWLKQQLPSTDFAMQMLAGLDQPCRHEDAGLSLGCFLSEALKDTGILILVTPPAVQPSAARDAEVEPLRLAAEMLSSLVAVRESLSAESQDENDRAEVLDAVLADSRNVARQALPFAALPWLARICSPREVAVHACIRPLLQAGAWLDPVILPCSSMTILEPKVGKVLEKFGLELTDFFLGERHVHGKSQARLDGLRLNPQFETAEGRIGESLAGLSQLLETGDPGVKKVVDGIREKVLYQLLNLKNKQGQSWHRQQEISRQQVEKALHYLFPLGQRQEELVNVNYFLVRYGRAFIQGIFQQAEAFASGHRLIPYAP